MVVMLPSFKVIRGPYVVERFVSALCGFFPSSNMFPMIGNGRGPGGSFVDSDVWLNSLRVKMRRVALRKGRREGMASLPPQIERALATDSSTYLLFVAG
ncbi:hypothetical protein VNO78_15416 [Psophocarpus tetragonolobus]|uniref:Uncharacterized protein n=1 Tax=Psophocarpus tetragonolobus TaxID=3891 RepID=A0AAN9XJK9_PSOTE